MRLENKITVITGAGHGIGRAIAEQFAREGAAVWIADIDEEAGRNAEAAIRSKGGEAWFVNTDVSQAESVDALFQQIARRSGRLDVLINNAGITLKKRLEGTTFDDWEHCLNTNLRSAWLCTRAAIPLMRQNHGGSIVYISSTHAHRTVQGFFPYAVSKGGLEALSRSVAVEYGPEGIRANSICPGMIRSRRTSAVLAQYQDPEAAYRRILESHPLKRIGEPEDIAKAALFLASDEACFITGTTLFVDGGRHAQMLDLSNSLRG